jgi:hypothetical protein
VFGVRFALHFEKFDPQGTSMRPVNDAVGARLDASEAGAKDDLSMTIGSEWPVDR